MNKTRTLLDGRDVAELESPITLEVYTRCPEKWMLIDLQTGERYLGNKESLTWDRIETCQTLT